MASSRHWFLRSLHVYLFLISYFVRGLNAQARGFTINPVKNFCSRWWSQSMVKNDVLYIDSGLQKFNGSDVPTPAFGINSYMITIPLNFTWDWKKNIIIESEAKNVTNPKTGTLPMSQMRGHMFHGPNDSPEIFLYGGTTYLGNTSFESFTWPDSSSYPLWSYNPETNDYPWEQYAISQPWMPNHGAAAEATDKGLAFYLNGQIDAGTSSQTVGKINRTDDHYIPLDGMVVIDLNTQRSNNLSTSAIRGNASRVGGTMEYIAPVGSNGILVALGGQIQPSWKPGSVANAGQGELIDFETVDVFDVDAYLQNPKSNGTWYQQKTSGEIPPPRIDFCTVAISAPDNSSHHIYLYGGRDPITDRAYDDVLILTLPSFTWTNVWPIGESPRWGHNCHIAGKRQMITVGGNITNVDSCDWEVKGVAVWDLSTLTWGSVYVNTLTDYQVPRGVLEQTGGTVNGNATVTDPVAGWTESGLKTVFFPGKDKQGEESPAKPKKKPSIALIAGAVGGGIAGLIIIAIIGFLLYRRRHKVAPHELASDEVLPHPPELSDDKHKFEMAVNENNPAELPGPPAAELCAPRVFVELDRETAMRAAELPGTNVVAGGVLGVPIVRTPGDDDVVPPIYTSGLNRHLNRSRPPDNTPTATVEQQRTSREGERGREQEQSRGRALQEQVPAHGGQSQQPRSRSQGEGLQQRSTGRKETVQQRSRSHGPREQPRSTRPLQEEVHWPLHNDVSQLEQRARLRNDEQQQRSTSRGEELQHRSRSRVEDQNRNRRRQEEGERWPRVLGENPQQRSRSHGTAEQQRARRRSQEERWPGIPNQEAQQRSRSHGTGEQQRSGRRYQEEAQWTGARTQEPQQRFRTHDAWEQKSPQHQQQRPRRPGGVVQQRPTGGENIEGGWI